MAKKKAKKKFAIEDEGNRRERPAEQEEILESQSMKQKKIAFAQSPHLEAVIQLLRESSAHNPLVGDTSHETVVNAVTLDAQSSLVMEFIKQVEDIKTGSLHNVN